MQLEKTALVVWTQGHGRLLRDSLWRWAGVVGAAGGAVVVVDDGQNGEDAEWATRQRYPGLLVLRTEPPLDQRLKPMLCRPRALSAGVAEARRKRPELEAVLLLDPWTVPGDTARAEFEALPDGEVGWTPDARGLVACPLAAWRVARGLLPAYAGGGADAADLRLALACVARARLRQLPAGTVAETPGAHWGRYPTLADRRLLADRTRSLAGRAVEEWGLEVPLPPDAVALPSPPARP